jgi:hypothetical protein
MFSRRLLNKNANSMTPRLRAAMMMQCGVAGRYSRQDAKIAKIAKGRVAVCKSLAP